MLTVHHLRVSQSERIVWLCEELSIPYRLVLHDRDPATGLAPAAYRALHPAGTAPVIEDGPLTLAESGAIIEYLARRHAGGRLLLGPDDPDFAPFLFWFHYANGSLMPSFAGPILERSAGDAGGGVVARFYTDRLERGLRMMEDRLRTVPFLAGDRFTAADVNMLFPLTTMRAFAPVDLVPYPAIGGYVGRLTGRQAYVDAMAKAEPA